MKIQYKNTSISIFTDAFSNITNEIRFVIESSLSDGDKLKNLFDYQFSLNNDKLIFGSTVTVPNMTDLFNYFKIEQSEVSMTVSEATNKWLINILYESNLLNINKTDWQIVE